MKKIAILGLFLVSLSLNAMKLSEKEKNIKVPVDFNKITLSNFIKELMSLDIPRTVSKNLYGKLKDLDQASYNDLTSSIMPGSKEGFINSLITLGVLSQNYYEQISGIVEKEESDSEEVLLDVRARMSELQARLFSVEEELQVKNKVEIDMILDRMTREIQDLEYLIIENKDKKTIDEDTAAALNLSLDDLKEEFNRLNIAAKKLEDLPSVKVNPIEFSDDERLARELQKEEYGVAPIESSISEDEDLARKLQEEEYGVAPAIPSESDDEDFARRLQEEYSD